MPTTPEDAVRHLKAQVSRHGGRRAEDRGMALAVRAGLQMVQPAEASTEIGAEPAHPRVPRQRMPLTTAGKWWLAYLTGIAAIAAWAYSAWQ